MKQLQDDGYGANSNLEAKNADTLYGMVLVCNDPSDSGQLQLQSETPCPE
jgi:hypothetical protein